MTIREETEAIERRTLSRYATLSENSLGRRTPLEDDPIRPCFQRDRDRILHCKAFRRQKKAEPRGHPDKIELLTIRSEAHARTVRNLISFEASEEWLCSLKAN